MNEMDQKLLAIADPDVERNCWLQIGSYIKRQGYGIEVWLQWSQKSTDWDEDECR